MDSTFKQQQLPKPLAVQLAVQVSPKSIKDSGTVMGATADDEGTSNMTTYTDD